MSSLSGNPDKIITSSGYTQIKNVLNGNRMRETLVLQYTTLPVPGILNHNRCVESDIVTNLGKDVLKELFVKRVSKIEHSLLAFAIAN
jgi:hypothetical protein